MTKKKLLFNFDIDFKKYLKHWNLLLFFLHKRIDAFDADLFV